MVSKWSAVCPAHHCQQRLMIEAPLAHRTPARRAIATWQPNESKPSFHGRRQPRRNAPIQGSPNAGGAFHLAEPMLPCMQWPFRRSLPTRRHCNSETLARVAAYFAGYWGVA